MSDSYDDYEMKMQLAEHAWEKRVVKTEHDRAVELGKAYERGWNAALAQQEPVAWLDAEMSQAYTIDELPDASGTGFLPLYTAPPKREWVGLTDEEINSVRYKRDWTATWTDTTFARAIEAKLKERNE
jgi:hypothetical protein